MNKIVIIGNGFDKAHGLLTGYSDFVEYLKNSISKFKNEGGRLELKGSNKESAINSNFYHRLEKSGNTDPWIGNELDLTNRSFNLAIRPDKNNSVYFKSLFEHQRTTNSWANLEYHYFDLLYKNINKPEKIKILNDEFKHLKVLLKGYLKTEIEDKIGFNCQFKIDKNTKPYKLLYDHQNNKDFEKTYFINFNYTSKILKQYLAWLKGSYGPEKFPLDPIQIHGDLEDRANPIIFGYGDENSNQYKEVELKLNNDLLVNFKTFQYLRTNNYSEILGLLEENENIYVQLIGHSSGLCDKALLRTIFQHKSVKKIESTYYRDESKYFENLYHISRTFDDNTLMRKKIIPLCETSKID